MPKLTGQSAWVKKAIGDYPGLVTNYMEVISNWEKAAREALAMHTQVPPPPIFNSPISTPEHSIGLYNSMIALWVPHERPPGQADEPAS